MEPTLGSPMLMGHHASSTTIGLVHKGSEGQVFMHAFLFAVHVSNNQAEYKTNIVGLLLAS